MKVVLICGPWGSGTSVIAGALARMGARGFGPYFMTNDANTPNSYESIPFRETILRHAIERKLSLIPCAPGAVQSSLKDLQRRIELYELERYALSSPRPIFLKYPLSALLIAEICEVFDTKLIYVMRPLEAIEQTRLRRKWPGYLGAKGAEVIYQHMSAALTRHRHRTMTINYLDLLASPMAHARDIARFADLEPTSAEMSQAIQFVRLPEKEVLGEGVQSAGAG